MCPARRMCAQKKPAFTFVPGVYVRVVNKSVNKCSMTTRKPRGRRAVAGPWSEFHEKVRGLMCPEDDNNTCDIWGNVWPNTMYIFRCYDRCSHEADVPRAARTRRPQGIHAADVVHNSATPDIRLQGGGLPRNKTKKAMLTKEE